MRFFGDGSSTQIGGKQRNKANDGSSCEDYWTTHHFYHIARCFGAEASG